MGSRHWRAILLCLAGFAGQAYADGEPCSVDQPMDNPEWQASCDAAIQAEENPQRLANLLFGRAYLAVEKYRYDDALADLEAALTANPDCNRCLHERAYVHAEMGHYADALEDLDREIRLTPRAASAYRERAYARKFSGDLAGAYEDRAQALELEPDSLDALLARGDAALWLGRFDDAAKDAKQARRKAQKAGDEKTQERAAGMLEEISQWRTTSKGPNPGARCVIEVPLDSTGPRTLIGDCSRAFLDAKTGPAKADALTNRSTAWTVVMDSPGNATHDMRMAAALDPGNPSRYVNLGFGYLSSRHSWAAKREFDRALALEPGWLALAGRAAARLNLQDPSGATEDAIASMNLEPNEPAALVLADIADQKGDEERARQLYLIAYRLGSRDERVLERLKELGVADPDSAVSP